MAYVIRSKDNPGDVGRGPSDALVMAAGARRMNASQPQSLTPSEPQVYLPDSWQALARGASPSPPSRRVSFKNMLYHQARRSLKSGGDRNA